MSRSCLPVLRVLVVTGVWSALLSGCGPAHIKSYEPKKRDFHIQQEAAKRKDPETRGSLWHRDYEGAHLFADMRAFKKDDLVVVAVEEVADAQRQSDTDLARNSSMGLGLRAIPIIGFLAAALTPSQANIDVTGSANADSSFVAGGSTGRTERLIATVPAVVREVLPNGNLLVEGHRVVLVNSEEQHLYVSGIVRTIDIDQSNTVKSSMIAEAEIEFIGRGVLSDNDRQGWFSRYFGWAWPF